MEDLEARALSLLPPSARGILSSPSSAHVYLAPPRSIADDSDPANAKRSTVGSAANSAASRGVHVSPGEMPATAQDMLSTSRLPKSEVGVLELAVSGGGAVMAVELSEADLAAFPEGRCE